MGTLERRIGIGLVEPNTAPTLVSIEARLRRAAAEGFSSAWIDHAFGWDALTVLAAVGPEVPGIELGTAAVPIYPRHPAALAQQAITTAALVGPRLTLGIGTSHRIAVERCFGLPFTEPLGHMAEHLEILRSLVDTGHASFAGAHLAANIEFHERPAVAIPVLVAALGPKMLDLAGRMSDGTIVWLATARALREYVVPALAAAANGAGRRPPRIVSVLPVCVSDDATGAYERAAGALRNYGRLPSYRGILDRSGAPQPADAAIIGDESSVASAVDDLFRAGATDVVPAIFGDPDEVERGWALFGQLARSATATVG